jgi:hypothetical protein
MYILLEKTNTAGQTAAFSSVHRRGTRILKPEMPDLQETSGILAPIKTARDCGRF